ncbi:MAG: DUF3180 domain-containing protein [Microbacteriaceae bacterium]
MKRINPLVLLGLTPFGFALGFGLDWVFVATGRPSLPVPWSLTVSLVLVGAVVVALGARVNWATKPKPGRRINPVTAVQILTLAQSAALSGAVVFGAIGGIIAFTVTRPVLAEDALPSATAGLIASIVLVVCALIAEWLCRVPPTDPEAEPA